MDREHYFVACPGLLGVATNLQHFAWSYGTTMPPATRSQFDRCEIRLHLDVADDVPMPAVESLGKYHYWYGSPGDDSLYYDRPFCCGTRLRLSAKGLLSDRPTLTVNRTYYRAVSHRFMNLHSVGYILTDIASLLLLRRGFAPLHCSSFRHGAATVVVAAAPNTGKTLTSMMACLDHSADYIAEDLAVSDGRDVFSVPWTSTFRYYRQIEQSFSTRLRSQATRWLPFVELVSARKPTPITEYVPPQRLVERSRVTHVVILERGAQGLESVDIYEGLRRLKNLNRYEFNYHKAPLVVAYEYFNPQLDIDAACRAEEATIRELLQNCEHLWVVRSDDPTQYASMIVDAIGSPTQIDSPELAVA